MRLPPMFGALERRVLQALWRREAAASVREVSADFPDTAYTTLMTTLDRLYRKGVLLREKSGRAFVYRPCVTRDQIDARAAAEALGAFLDQEPDAIRPALSFLVDAIGRYDERLLEELEALVRQKRREEGEKR